nr:MAG TPA: NADH-ubiquinone oxidoreductase [Caudoviricetes sp.]
MDAVEFFKTANRLCKNQSCGKCPVCKEGVCMAMNLVRLDGGLVESIEETVSKVEQWAKKHPIKTRQSEFLKMFPNADLCRDVINILPCSVEKEMSKCCDNKRCVECRREYWTEELPDND